MIQVKVVCDVCGRTEERDPTHCDDVRALIPPGWHINVDDWQVQCPKHWAGPARYYS